MKYVFKGLPVLALAVAGANAVAADANPSTAIGLRTGFTGHGVDLIVPVAESLNVRIGVSKASIKRDFTESDIDYNATLDLGAGSMIADWYPFDGGFRLSTGLVRNTARFDLLAKPSANAKYNIGGTEYDASSLGSVSARVSFSRSPAPYFGFGWGNASERSAFGVTFELGWIVQHSPTVKFTAECVEQIACVGLQQSIDEEQKELNESFRVVRGFPVLNLGVSYRF